MEYSVRQCAERQMISDRKHSEAGRAKHDKVFRGGFLNAPSAGICLMIENTKGGDERKHTIGKVKSVEK